MERKRGVVIFSLNAFQNVHDPFGRGTFPEKSPLQLFQIALKMHSLWPRVVCERLDNMQGIAEMSLVQIN